MPLAQLLTWYEPAQCLLHWFGTYKDGIGLVTVVIGAIWTLRIYGKSKKREAADWRLEGPARANSG
jgi:hypothetical protein